MKKLPSEEALTVARSFVYRDGKNAEKYSISVFNHTFVYTTAKHAEQDVEQIVFDLAVALDQYGLEYLLKYSWNPLQTRGQG